MVKKLWIRNKIRKDPAKSVSRRIVQKTAEAPGGLIGNKITDERKSAGKSKNTGKEEDNEVNKMQEIDIPLEKCLSNY